MVSQPNSNAGLYDRLGVLVSTACAVHCAMVPILLGILPTAGVALGDERLEWLLLALAGVIASFSLGRGYQRHRSKRVLVALSVGLSLLVVARAMEQVSDRVVAAALVSVMGAGVLIYGHLHNLRLSRRRVSTS